MAKSPRPTPDAAPDAGAGDPAAEAGTKGHPTPRRKEQEAANKRPLVPGDRGRSSKEARARMRDERERARVGMARGEERYLPARDKGPQKRFVRDYVDARLSLGEAVLPLLVVVILTYFLPSILPATLANEITAIALVAVWSYLVVVVIEGVVVGRMIVKRLEKKFGKSRVERVRFYAFMRMAQIRPLRLPKPQVRRGEFPS